jgi:hypothetical protein
MFKMGSHCSFGHPKRKLWPKEGPRVKLSVWFSTRKIEIDPIYLFADGVRHTVEKLSTRATTLLQTTFRSEVCSQSYGAPKSRESQLGRFRDSHLGVSGQKAIWMWAPWRGVEYTIRGKVVASPKSGPWWVLCVCVVVACPSTKSAPTTH